MLKRIVYGIMLTLLLIGMLTLTLNVSPINADPKTIIVPDDYPTIQEAINYANDGDTIFVYNGTYYENVVVNKSVFLIGENRNDTIINGHYVYKTSVVLVTVDNVQIRGFTIQNGWCGVAVYSSNGCVITENKIMNNTYRGGGPQIVESGRGVWLIDSKNCTIASNLINENDRNISLEEADNNTIMDNTITKSLISWGIILESSDNNSITNNVVRYSVYDGICLAFANNNDFVANLVMYNGDEGIDVGLSENNVFIKNIVKNNSGEGICLGWSNNSEVIRNTLVYNGKRGIMVWHSSSTMVYHNNLINNSWGQEYSNLINTWDNGYPSGGNYWSDYDGTDCYSGPYQNEPGSDGIGDTPHVLDADNQDNYPLMKPYPWDPHDIGITTVITSKTVVGQGYCLHINTTIFNYGMFAETFNVTIYLNETIINTLTDITLTSRNSTTVTFTWNTTGFAKGNHTISANATIVPDETDTADNNFTNGWIAVTIPGDIDGNREIDVFDAILLAGSLCHPELNPNADINSDNIIDIYDAIILATNYGKEDS